MQNTRWKTIKPLTKIYIGAVLVGLVIAFLNALPFASEKYQSYFRKAYPHNHVYQALLEVNEKRQLVRHRHSLLNVTDEFRRGLAGDSLDQIKAEFKELHTVRRYGDSNCKGPSCKKLQLGLLGGDIKQLQIPNSTFNEPSCDPQLIVQIRLNSGNDYKIDYAILLSECSFSYFPPVSEISQSYFGKTYPNNHIYNALLVANGNIQSGKISKASSYDITDEYRHAIRGYTFQQIIADFSELGANEAFNQEDHYVSGNQFKAGKEYTIGLGWENISELKIPHSSFTNWNAPSITIKLKYISNTDYTIEKAVISEHVPRLDL